MSPLLARFANAQNLHFTRQSVRLVHVDALDEVDLVAAAGGRPRKVGELAGRGQVVGLHQRDAVLEVEPRAGLDLLPDRCGRLQHVEDCHVRYLSRLTTACVKDSSSSRCNWPFRQALSFLA